MKTKLNCILLIDDDEATNFIHEMVISQENVTDRIVAVESGQEALDFLTTKENDSYVQPDVIFLDINMPGMNGWEFLEKYNVLDENQKGNAIMIMLTTSLNPDDAIKAKSYGAIKNFLHKPLTSAMLSEVIREYFPDKL
jgi:CheY-like chemotaxis protein